MLNCSNLSKTYGAGTVEVKALDNINFKIQKGEYVAIIGGSGSGKSTLLHMLGGVDSPTSGEIYIDQTNIVTLPEKELAIFRRRKVGLIYQFYNLIPTLNVRKNILLPMLLDGRKVNEDEFNSLVHTLGLQDRLNHMPHELSGGQQQRVSIGRALIYRPAILLADEPTGNLDHKNSDEIVELFRIANTIYNQTIILITHDEKVALCADRIITIEDGKIVSDKAVK
ncbi:peptide ABC transporter ATP-binding protein [Candidatus Epulonipiscium fishelsonii]|uniref:Peptide ABC transporter ATP-binding protein n=1 Tax=Candidatus Epulonipiscium fishelsonii TaxID=77094 RepID=A0ACC8X9Z4_9FIRM|nr:peptide ABC transporter ATP-binding protein [Epulopiscium sp. SCG-B11WGA-EpuloA1]ONI42012.1 peptide ABC transporter ATP-binding protein [Epulopiscium sp. SCG-B05WGA-EpuloA1]